MITPTLAEGIILALIFMLGASLGSFLNVVCLRWPLIRAGRVEQGKPVTLSHPASRCPHCLNKIKWHDNLPVIGWIKRRGRCASCNTPFSPTYAIYEALAGTVFVLPLWLLPVTSVMASGALSVGLLLALYAPALFRSYRRVL